MGRLPEFKSKEEERRFWDKADITEFLDELAEVEVEYKPPRKRVLSIRMDPQMYDRARRKAREYGLSITAFVQLAIAKALEEGVSIKGSK